jgi:hypothetical protein
MLTFVYDVLFGYTMLSIIDGVCTKIKDDEPVHSTYTGCLRRLRVRHLEYWHPE